MSSEHPRHEPETPPARNRPARRRGKLAAVRRLVLALLALGVALLLAEGLVRLLRPQQTVLLRPDIWQPHDGLGWVMAPHLRTRVNTGEREVCLATDEHGWRIDCDGQQRDGQRILAVGDSFLAALQVESTEAFARLLADRLSERVGERMTVDLAAVAGWGPSHYRLVVRSELARRSYRALLVAVFLGNDIEDRRVESFPPKQAKVRHRPRLPRDFARQEIVDALLYPVNDWLERRSHLFLLCRSAAWQVLMRLGLSGRRFPEACLTSEAGSERWRVTAEILRDIDREARRHGVAALFALVPGAYQVDRQLGRRYAAALGLSDRQFDLDQPARLLLAQPAMRGLTVVDTTESLRRASERGGERLYGTVDTHLAPRGHRLVAARREEPLLRAVLDTEQDRSEG